MLEGIFKIIAPVVIVSLIIWLMYRIKRQIRLIIKDEIYNNLPSLKDVALDFERRLDYLKNQASSLENKIKELESKAAKL